MLERIQAVSRKEDFLSSKNIFPKLDFHFSPKEIGYMFPVNNENRRFAENACSSSITKALGDERKCVVFGGPMLKDLLVLSRVGENVIAMRRFEEKDSAGEETYILSMQEIPLIKVSFEDDNNLIITMSIAESSSQGQSLRIESSLAAGFMIFAGKVVSVSEQSYEYRGGLILQGAVNSEREHEAYMAVREAIRETEQDKKAGKHRKVYLEPWIEVGNILIYREIHPKETIITRSTYSVVVNKAPILLPGQSWFFRQH